MVYGSQAGDFLRRMADELDWLAEDAARDDPPVGNKSPEVVEESFEGRGCVRFATIPSHAGFDEGGQMDALATSVIW